MLVNGSCHDCLQYFGAVRYGKYIYLASEYASGGDLEARTLRSPITNDEIVQLLKQGAQLADKGIINKDIKLQNIVVMTNGDVKIMDYGLAQRNPTRIVFSGSFHTISPEIVQQKYLSPDLMNKVHSYSLGMTILDGKSDVLRKNYQDIIKNNTTGKQSNSKYIEIPPFSSAEKDILVKMMDPNINNRISIDEALTRWEAVSSVQ